MKKDVLNIEVCNSADLGQSIDLFNMNSVGDKKIVDKEWIIRDLSGPITSGDPLPSLNIWSNSFLDTQRNILYVGTDAGLWIYDTVNDSGSIITTSTVINGDALPSNQVEEIDKDLVNNILFLEANDEFYVYDIDTNTGKLYTQTSGVSSGVNLPDKVSKFSYDKTNNIAWVAGTAYLWRLDLSTNTGTDVSIVSYGDNFPSDNTITTHYNISSGFIFIGTKASGLYRYDNASGSGLIYNTSTGVGSGLNIPDNQVNYQIGADENIIYVPTINGLWVYDILNDIGSIINTSSSISGDAMPDNNVYTVYFNNDILYMGFFNDVLMLNLLTNTGTNISVVTGGVRPSNESYSIIYYNDMLYENIKTNGVWKYTEVSSEINITSNSQSTVSYEYIVNDVQQSPIEISKIILTTDNDRQKYNSLTHIIETIAGSDVQYTVHFSNYVNPLMPFKQVHVDLEQPLLIDYEKFLRITIEANTCIQLLFEYEQQSPASLIEHLSPDEKDILPIYYEEQKDGKLIKTVSLNKSDKVAMIPEPEFKWLPPWVVMAIISILLQFKSKK